MRSWTERDCNRYIRWKQSAYPVEGLLDPFAILRDGIERLQRLLDTLAENYARCENRKHRYNYQDLGNCDRFTFSRLCSENCLVWKLF